MIPQNRTAPTWLERGRSEPATGPRYTRSDYAERKASARARSHLLVVDDEPTMCELLALFFENQGMQVTTAQTVNEGSWLIEDEDFDLAILDWKLEGEPKGMDLLELSRARHPEVPVIIFTGAEDPQCLSRQLAGRAAAVMPKIGSLNALSAEVCKHLSR